MRPDRHKPWAGLWCWLRGTFCSCSDWRTTRMTDRYLTRRCLRCGRERHTLRTAMRFKRKETRN